MSDPKPRLPSGTSSTLKGLQESFSFHSSPEEFITARVLEFQKKHPELIDSRSVVRAKILNRNVAIVSSHSQIREVLCSSGNGGDSHPAYTAGDAYDELMAPFFPSPNVLLADGPFHTHMRQTWEQRMASLPETLTTLIGEISRDHFSSAASVPETDLYASMKDLSWRIMLGVFLHLSYQDSAFATVEQLQEELLRGQFSLMPVSINAGFWHSPRKKGVTAKKRLQELIKQRIISSKESCPFAHSNETQLDDIVNHILLFTSSLAVKALASLLTAFFMNLYIMPLGEKRGFATDLASCTEEVRTEKLRSILLETERLSPSIVGIMRRSMQENVISSANGEPDVLIPKGWDVWLYFVGAGRDPATYGDSWDLFNFDRYARSEASAPGLAFGAGSKTCLGQHFITNVVIGVAKTCLNMGLDMEGAVQAQGVRAWLGWEVDKSVSPEDWARDMKQLPTQHPAEPVLVRFSIREQRSRSGDL